VTLLSEHNNPFPLFLEQYIPFTDDAVPLYVHMSALSRYPGAFRRQHGVYFTVTHFHNFCSPFSLYQKITPSIRFHDWSCPATLGTPASDGLILLERRGLCFPFVHGMWHCSPTDCDFKCVFNNISVSVVDKYILTWRGKISVYVCVSVCMCLLACMGVCVYVCVCGEGGSVWFQNVY